MNESRVHAMDVHVYEFEVRTERRAYNLIRFVNKKKEPRRCCKQIAKATTFNRYTRHNHERV